MPITRAGSVIEVRNHHRGERQIADSSQSEELRRKDVMESENPNRTNDEIEIRKLVENLARDLNQSCGRFCEATT